MDVPSMYLSKDHTDITVSKRLKRYIDKTDVLWNLMLFIILKRKLNSIIKI